MPPDEEPQPDHDVPAGPEDAGHLWPQEVWDEVVSNADAIAWRQALADGEVAP
jgi:hypothetical protein